MAPPVELQEAHTDTFSRSLRLDAANDLEERTTKAELREPTQGEIVTQGELAGAYSRSR